MILEMFQHPEFCFSSILRMNSGELMWRWLIRNKIKVATLEIGDYDDLSPSAYFLEFGQYVQSVALTEYSILADMDMVSKHCSQLKTLTCTSIFIDEHFRDILCRNPHIHTLHLGGVGGSSAVNLTGISLPHLHTINVNNCKCDDVFAVGLSLLSRQITRLDLYYCTEVSPEALLAIVRNCPQLHALGLGGLNISDTVLRHITKLRPQLYNLILYGNEIVTDAGLKDVLQNLSAVRYLDIQACTRLTDSALGYIGTYAAHSLEVLYIGEHMSFGLPATTAMLQRCVILRTLVWSVLPDVTLTVSDLHAAFSALHNINTLLLGDGLAVDDALGMVATHCQTLQYLNLYKDLPRDENDNLIDIEDPNLYAPRYTAEGVFALAKGCLMLRTVVAKDTLVLNDLAKLFWKALRPRITFSTDDTPYCSSVSRVPL